MRQIRTKLIAILFALSVHLLLLIVLISINRLRVNTFWSGGNGQMAVHYIYLDSVKVSGVDKKENENNVVDDKKYSDLSKVELSVKNKMPINLSNQKKISSQSVSQKKILNSSDDGSGQSDMPAGGQGNGADQSGQISDVAPNVLALIRKKIMKHKSYPTLAKQNKWTGKVKVSFKIKVDGSLDFVKVLQTSGYAELDDDAINTIKSSAPLPYYPAEIALTLEYELN